AVLVDRAARAGRRRALHDLGAAAARRGRGVGVLALGAGRERGDQGDEGDRRTRAKTRAGRGSIDHWGSLSSVATTPGNEWQETRFLPLVPRSSGNGFARGGSAGARFGVLACASVYFLEGLLKDRQDAIALGPGG